MSKYPLVGDPVAPLKVTTPLHSPLEGRFVRLQAPDPDSETPSLYAASHGDADREQLWTYLGYGPFANEQAMRAQLHKHAASSDPLFFTVWDQQTNRPVGMVSFMRIDVAMGVIELGHIWYTPAAQRSRINTESLYLMLTSCFSRGFRRVEWKCDALNRRSREAALRLGFSFEGIFRQHMVYKGRNRDTAWFSLLDREWPQIKANFQHWLYEDSSESLYSLNARVGRYRSA